MVQTRDDEATPQANASVRLCQPGDEEEMLQVLTAAFDGWPKFKIPVEPIDHLRWRLQGYDPAALPNLSIIAKVGGRIASLRLNLLRRVWVGGNVRLMALHSHIATHPDFQGQGIYSVLRVHPDAEQLDYVDLSFGWTVNPIVRHIASVSEPRRALDNKVLVKVLDSQRMSQHSPGGAGALRRNPAVRALAFSGVAVAQRLRYGREAQTFAGEIQRVETFDERFDEFWREAAKGFDFIGERSSAFLNWRYGDRRGGEHVVLVASEAERVLGYAAVWDNDGRGQVLDLLALPGRLDVARSLLRAAEDWFRSSGLYAAECRMAARNPYERVFAEQGYVDPHRESNFYYLGQRLSQRETALIESKTSVIHLLDGDL